MGSILGLGRSPREGHGSPLQSRKPGARKFTLRRCSCVQQGSEPEGCKVFQSLITQWAPFSPPALLLRDLWGSEMGSISQRDYLDR